MLPVTTPYKLGQRPHNPYGHFRPPYPTSAVHSGGSNCQQNYEGTYELPLERNAQKINRILFHDHVPSYQSRSLYLAPSILFLFPRLINIVEGRTICRCGGCQTNSYKLNKINNEFQTCVELLLGQKCVVAKGNCLKGL